MEMSSPGNLQQVLHEQIPITWPMGITVVSCNEAGLVLEAPLGPNLNDKGTAFAGSLGSLVTLAGWCLLRELLQEAGVEARIAITRSNLTFHQPVSDTLRAICPRPGAAQVGRFLKTLQAKGKARIPLTASIGRETAVSFEGEYVAYLHEQKDHDHV